MADEMVKGKVHVIIGGQAGSEAKGKLSGYLCDKHQPDIIAMAASPNAGHTVVDDEGHKFVSYHIPIGSVTCNAQILLGPSSLINIEILEKELKDLQVDPGRVFLDPRASIIYPRHIEKESKDGHTDIGSTCQGIGECRISKINRDGSHVMARDVSDPLRKLGIHVKETVPMLHSSLDMLDMVFLEATQGFDLDLEHGIDPRYCTSKMINTSMVLAEAGIPPARVGEIFGVIRPYPIRVNNRTGTSGPYAEAEEINWTMVARRCGYPGDPDDFGEITTTTKLPRRVFEFSWKRFAHFMNVCNPTVLCLQFANYIDWKVYGVRTWDELTPDVVEFIKRLDYVSGVHTLFIGTGPRAGEMVEATSAVPKYY